MYNRKKNKISPVYFGPPDNVFENRNYQDNDEDLEKYAVSSAKCPFRCKNSRCCFSSFNDEELTRFRKDYKTSKDKRTYFLQHCRFKGTINRGNGSTSSYENYLGGQYICSKHFTYTIGCSSSAPSRNRNKGANWVDKRGAKVGKNVISEENVNKLKKFLDSIPRSKSHYNLRCRKLFFHNDNYEYYRDLEQLYDLCIKETYQNYESTRKGRGGKPPFQLDWFKAFVNHYTDPISGVSVCIKPLKTDVCEKCASLQNTIQYSTDDVEVERARKELHLHNSMATQEYSFCNELSQVAKISGQQQQEKKIKMKPKFVMFEIPQDGGAMTPHSLVYQLDSSIPFDRRRAGGSVLYPFDGSQPSEVITTVERNTNYLQGEKDTKTDQFFTNPMQFSDIPVLDMTEVGSKFKIPPTTNFNDLPDFDPPENMGGPGLTISPPEPELQSSDALNIISPFLGHTSFRLMHFHPDYASVITIPDVGDQVTRLYRIPRLSVNPCVVVDKDDNNYEYIVWDGRIARRTASDSISMFDLAVKKNIERKGWSPNFIFDSKDTAKKDFCGLSQIFWRAKCVLSDIEYPDLVGWGSHRFSVGHSYGMADVCGGDVGSCCRNPKNDIWTLEDVYEISKTRNKCHPHIPNQELFLDWKNHLCSFFNVTPHDSKVVSCSKFIMIIKKELKQNGTIKVFRHSNDRNPKDVKIMHEKSEEEIRQFLLSQPRKLYSGPLYVKNCHWSLFELRQDRLVPKDYHNHWMYNEPPFPKNMKSPKKKKKRKQKKPSSYIGMEPNNFITPSNGEKMVQMLSQIVVDDEDELDDREEKPNEKKKKKKKKKKKRQRPICIGVKSEELYDRTKFVRPELDKYLESRNIDTSGSKQDVSDRIVLYHELILGGKDVTKISKGEVLEGTEAHQLREEDVRLAEEHKDAKQKRKRRKR